MVFLANGRGQAQQQPKRIGFLAGVSQSAIAGRLNAFRQGLRNLGYLENKNILIEFRSAEESMERLRGFAAELVHLKVHVIVTGGPPATRSAKVATSSVPIVMGFDSDPVGNGFVASLARPGANITGFSAISPEMSGKQLELLKEVIPKVSQIAVIGSSVEPANARILQELKIAAPVLGLTMHNIEIGDSKSMEDGFRAATKSGAGAALVLPSLFTYAERTDFVGDRRP